MNVLRNRMSSARLSKIFPRKRVRAGDRRSGVLTRLIEANRAICARGVARIAHGYSQIGSPVPEVEIRCRVSKSNHRRMQPSREVIRLQKS